MISSLTSTQELPLPFGLKSLCSDKEKSEAVHEVAQEAFLSLERSLDAVFSYRQMTFLGDLLLCFTFPVLLSFYDLGSEHWRVVVMRVFFFTTLSLIVYISRPKYTQVLLELDSFRRLASQIDSLKDRLEEYEPFDILCEAYCQRRLFRSLSETQKGFLCYLFEKHGIPLR